jgi:hypothetical protein
MMLVKMWLVDGYCESSESIRAALPVAIFVGRSGEGGLNFELSAHQLGPIVSPRCPFFVTGVRNVGGLHVQICPFFSFFSGHSGSGNSGPGYSGSVNYEGGCYTQWGKPPSPEP